MPDSRSDQPENSKPPEFFPAPRAKPEPPESTPEEAFSEAPLPKRTRPAGAKPKRKRAKSGQPPRASKKNANSSAGLPKLMMLIAGVLAGLAIVLALVAMLIRDSGASEDLVERLAGEYRIAVDFDWRESDASGPKRVAIATEPGFLSVSHGWKGWTIHFGGESWSGSTDELAELSIKCPLSQAILADTSGSVISDTSPADQGTLNLVFRNEEFAVISENLPRFSAKRTQMMSLDKWNPDAPHLKHAKVVSRREERNPLGRLVGGSVRVEFPSQPGIVQFRGLALRDGETPPPMPELPRQVPQDPGARFVENEFQPGGGIGIGPDAPQKPQSIRPKDLAVWTVEDFQTAMDDNDPQTYQAIQTVEKQAVKDDPEAQTTSATKLLSILKIVLAPESQEFGEDDFGRPRFGGPRPIGIGLGNETRSAADFVEAIFTGLADNSSEIAFHAFRNAILGEPVVENFKLESYTGQVAPLALQSIINRISEHAPAEQFLFDLILGTQQAPKSVHNAMPRGMDLYGEPNIHFSALREFLKRGSPPQRARLAKHCLEADDTPRRKIVIAFLMEPQPKNLEAQMLLFSDRGLPQSGLRDSLAQTFLQASHSAIKGLLGVPSPAKKNNRPQDELNFPRALGDDFEGVPQQSQDVSFAKEDVPLVVKTLWNDQFVALIGRELDQPQANRETVVSLLASIPTRSARVKLEAELKKHYDDVPLPIRPLRDNFETLEGLYSEELLGGLGDAETGMVIKSFRQDWWDPGALVVLKNLNQGLLPNKRELSQLSTEQKWSLATFQCLRQLNNRLALVPGLETVPEELVRIPEYFSTGELLAETRIQWPAMVASQLKDAILEPLSLQFMRIQFPKSSRVNSEVEKFVGRQQEQLVNSALAGESAKEITWFKNSRIETQAEGTSPNSRIQISTDAVVSTVGDKTIVEILVLRIPQK